MPETWTPEKDAEFKKLYRDFCAAVDRAGSILQSKGMASEEFRLADAASTELWSKLRALQGKSGQHWMS